MDNLSSLDIIVAMVVAIFGIKGFMNGFLKEVLGFIGLVSGAYLSSKLSKTFAPFFNQNILHIENESLLSLIVFIVIFGVIWLLFLFLGSLLSQISKATGLGLVNNIFGFIIGGGKYFLLFALFFTTISRVSLLQSSLKGLKQSSIFYPYLITTGTLFMDKNSSNNEHNSSIYHMIKAENNISTQKASS